MKGLFITFEGIEGCGKTTQIKLLADYLRGLGREAVLTREPGGSSIGDQIRSILLNSSNTKMSPIAELLLYAAARNQHIYELIRPALSGGKIVLCDRYADATTAYQGAARNIDIYTLMMTHKIATDGLMPNLTILFDCPVEVGLSRAKKRNQSDVLMQGQDRFEQEAFGFHNRVRNGYLEIAKREPNRVIVVDATKGVNELHQEIVIHVQKFLDPKFGSCQI